MSGVMNEMQENDLMPFYYFCLFVTSFTKYRISKKLSHDKIYTEIRNEKVKGIHNLYQ